MAVLKMQRISICALKKDRKAILEKLQSLGVVEINHVIEEDEDFKKMDTAGQKAGFEKASTLAEQAIDILDKYVPEKKSMFASLEGKALIEREEEERIRNERRDLLKTAKQIGRLDKERSEQMAEITKLNILCKQRDKDTPRLTLWEFDPCGIPLGEWEDKRARIETALNITIAKMTWAEGRKIICVYAVPAESDFLALLPWKDKYLSPDSFVLVLGESLTGPVTVNLANIPHILLGGSTGSGKSVLLKLLLMQAVEKGAEVYIADFKGGVDFPRVWRQKCHMCFREDELLHTLDQLTAVLECRKKRLEETECKDLDTYNEATGEGLPRLVFACDEVAEMLDKTGADNERKKLLAQIENKLSTIARQGRAFGIHLILATQRPDATIIPGQIRNNMDFRVCGRADSVLSQIILDNTSAAEQIPKDARGRFITGDGTVFQGYLFDEERF